MKGFDVRIDGGSAIDAGDDLTHVFSGLTASTEYDIEVRKRDEAGNVSAWSSIVSQTTQAGVSGDVDIVSGGVLGWQINDLYVNTFSQAYTCHADADCLVVCVFTTYGADATGITFDGAAMTLVTNLAPASGNRLSMYRLLNPTATTANVVITYGSNGRYGQSVIVPLKNVNQTTPTGTPVTLTASSGVTSPSITVTGAVGDLVLDMFEVDTQYGATSITPDGSQTTLYNDDFRTGTLGGFAGVSTKAGAASVTMEWSTDVASIYGLQGVAFKKA